ncbi:MAG: hypothetical protein DRO16_05580, partial [Thermoprotei archaeon]
MKILSNSTSKAVLLGVVLVTALLLRIAPSFYSNNLFSTDVWPLYRDTLVLTNNPSLKIFDDKSFDGYNNRWPGVILSTTYYSVLTGLDPSYVYMYVYVIVLGLSTMLGFFILAKRFEKNISPTISLLIFSLIPSLIVFTASPLKEVYAYPLFYIIMYYFTKIVLGRASPRDYFIVIVSATAMLLVHHLAIYMLTGFWISILLVGIIHKLVIGGDSLDLNLRGSILIYLYLLFSMTTYFLVIGYKYMSSALSTPYIETFLIYAFTVYLGYLVFYNDRAVSEKTLVAIILLLLVSVLLMYKTVFLLPGVLVYKDMIIWYVLPIIPGLLLYGIKIDDLFLKTIIFGTGLFIFLNTVFVLLGAPIYSSILHRFADYVVIPISLLAGYMFRKPGVIYKSLTILLASLTILSGTMVIYNIVTYNPDVSFFWYYPSV